MKRANTACVHDDDERAFAPGRLCRADGNVAFATALDDCVVCLAQPTRFVVWPCGHAVCSACDEKLAEQANGDARACPSCRRVAHASEMATLEMPEAKLAEYRELELLFDDLSTATARGSTAEATAPTETAAPNGGIVLGHATLRDDTPAFLLSIPKDFAPADARFSCRALVVLLDDSGSMNDDWQPMVRELRVALEAMCADPTFATTYVAFLSFSSGARVRVAPCALAPERIDDIVARLVECDGGMTHVDVGLKLADETARAMAELLARDGVHATPTIVVVTDGDATNAEDAALALAATRAPVHVVAYGAHYTFAACDGMFKYARRGGTSMLFTRADEPSALAPALAAQGAHGVCIAGGAGSRCYYNGAVVDFDGTHVVVVDPRHGLVVGFTGPVDVASLSLYGVALDVAPSFRRGMDVRDFLLSTVVTQYAQKLALDRDGLDGLDANGALLRRARALVARVAPTLGSVLAMLDGLAERLDERRTDLAGRTDLADRTGRAALGRSCAVARAVSCAVRAYTCPA
jgi:Mg-chelatase subunit ChlD